MKFIIRFAAKNTIVWNEKPQKDNLSRCIRKWLGETTSRGKEQNKHKENEIINLFPIEIEGMFGYSDKSGKVVIPCQWLYTEGSSEGLARIHKWNSWDDNYQGFIDKNGDLLIPCIWIDAYNFGEGLAAVMNEKYKWGFINKKGEIVIPCKWNSVEDKEHHVFGKVGFIDGEIIVEGKKNGKWYETVGKYVIDKRGNVIKEL